MYCKDDELLQEAAEEKLWSFPHWKVFKSIAEK